MIEDRNLQPGTRLEMRHRGKEYGCEVLGTPEGLRFRLDDGKEFRSISSAAKEVVGSAANGWRAWSIAGELKPKRERPAKKEKPATSAKAKTTRTTAKKASKKSAAKKPKGKAMRAASKTDSYGCGVCSETFGSQQAAIEHAMQHTAA